MNHPQTELILSHILMVQDWILGFVNVWRERKTQVSQEKDPLKKLPQWKLSKMTVIFHIQNLSSAPEGQTQP